MIYARALAVGPQRTKAVTRVEAIFAIDCTLLETVDK